MYDIFAIIGGDERMRYAGERLADMGFSVRSYAVPSAHSEEIVSCRDIKTTLDGADFILLPVPLSRDFHTLWAPAHAGEILLNDVLLQAPKSARILGGGSLADSRFVNYACRDDFACENAVPTAEGALLIAMQKLSCTIRGMHVGVVGFGRVGRAVASLFRAAGAFVTVFARRDEVCSAASVLGYCSAPISTLCTHAEELRCLINTVPSPVIGCDTLCVMRKDAIILELASEPYGVDFEAARNFGVQAVLARGLPGKYSPETAGNVIAATVLNVLCEEGVPLKIL